jgi:hypothetical protein
MDSAFEIPQLTRSEEYDDPTTFLMPDPSWLVRTTAEMGERNEEISEEAYWADVFGNNWQDDDAAYWAEIFGDWEDPLDYDDDAGEVYDMLLLE